MPLGATVARADIMTWPPGAHASTFGGNPVACAAALTTIALLEEELMENAARMGEYIMNRLEEWPRRFDCVGDVRGLGLMIGVEFVRDQKTREKAPDVRDKLLAAGFEPRYSKPAELDAFLKAEIQKWRPIVRDSGASLD